MGKKAALQEYRERRDLERSPEPKGGSKKTGKKPIFVIQKHDARRLHYDVRIEINGVLASWAVPKGPSTDPSEKRLAVPTDDHPLEYADFEGVIPEGAYGAGVVMVWDRGTYENIKKDEDGELVPIDRCYNDGQIEIRVHGEKVQGGYALVRTGQKRGGKHNWLLVKMKDEYADARRNPTSTENKSVKTGRTLSEIRQDAQEKKE